MEVITKIEIENISVISIVEIAQDGYSGLAKVGVRMVEHVLVVCTLNHPQPVRAERIAELQLHPFHLLESLFLYP